MEGCVMICNELFFFFSHYNPTLQNEFAVFSRGVSLNFKVHTTYNMCVCIRMRSDCKLLAPVMELRVTSDDGPWSISEGALRAQWPQAI